LWREAENKFVEKREDNGKGERKREREENITMRLHKNS
jgi:hypothetical protein